MAVGYRKASIPWVRRKARIGRSGRAITLQSFLKYDLVCSRKRSVPFWAGNGKVALIGARLSAAIKREIETMPSTQNGTVRIAARRPALRVVGEAIGPPRRQRNSERRPREYLTPAEVEVLILT